MGSARYSNGQAANYPLKHSPLQCPLGRDSWESWGRYSQNLHEEVNVSGTWAQL